MTGVCDRGGLGRGGWDLGGVGREYLDRIGGYNCGKSSVLGRFRMVSRSVEVFVAVKRAKRVLGGRD